MKLLTLWQSFRNVWVMQWTTDGFVTDDSPTSNTLAIAMLVELALALGYLLS